MLNKIPAALPIALTLLLAIAFLGWYFRSRPPLERYTLSRDSIVRAPSLQELPHNDSGETIRYGRELIAGTAAYFGPQGSVARISNGMNCQNCHLKAGTQTWGNNYVAVAATYPKYRERSGSVESIVKRVSDCFERSLNGRAPDSTSREMKAIVAYIRWTGSAAKKGKKPPGSGIRPPDWMSRAASPEKGLVVYRDKCARCHQPGGEGVLDAVTGLYTYPPLWGPHSYNTGAGLFRLSLFAGFVRDNMPFGATYAAPQLSEEDAWDVAAFVNDQPRPRMDLSHDWPKLRAKPADHPFPPFPDSFSARQHKFGPWQPIKAYAAATRNT